MAAKIQILYKSASIYFTEEQSEECNFWAWTLFFGLALVKLIKHFFLYKQSKKKLFLQPFLKNE